MSVNKIVIGVSAGLIALTGLVYFIIQDKQTELSGANYSNVSIEQTWELPKVLEEISGIAFLENNRIACVQDEDGSIFIFNLESLEIEEKIDFAGAGDYEGITTSGSTAYVLRSDGTIYKVEDFETTPDITEHATPLTRKQDVEGLCYDPGNNRLLLAIKEREPESDTYKGVYAVNLQTMKMGEEPVFKLQLGDAIFKDIDEKKPYNKFMPSEININPETGEIYMLAATSPMLLVLNPDGNPKELFHFNKEDVPQPEGLTFDPAGTIYISSEGNPASIHQISLN